MTNLNLESTIELNDGVAIPLFGLGMYEMSLGETSVNAVKIALTNGYKLIDTAAYYKYVE